MKHGLSKSRYTTFKCCEKALWMSVYKPEEEIITDSQNEIFERGSQVGDLAMGLLGDYEEMTTLGPDGAEDKNMMIAKTKDALARGVVNICEAAFSYEGNYCAVDILHKTAEGYEIYEVKSSASADKEIFVWDIAYQKFVLTKCGLNVTGTFLVCINNQYVRQGQLELGKLFKINSLNEAVEAEVGNVAANVQRAQSILEGREPDTSLSMGCHKPYDCRFWEYCTKALLKPSVFDVNGLRFDRKLALHNEGKDSFESIRNINLNSIQREQVEFTLKGINHIDEKGIQSFLDTFNNHYPLYYLDFESIQPAVPVYDGTRPYQQLTTQFSLHIQDSPRGKVTHQEFLAPSKGNPLRPVAEALCQHIPTNVLVIVYNKAFECTRLRELAEMFPDLSKHLLAIRENVNDLLVPFKKGYYYMPAMGGSFSIKSVLPALFPNDPDLSYKGLDEICQNGDDAKNLFPKLQDMSPEEESKARRALLDYCCLDTLAMVKVMDKLYEAVEQ